jgi:hypothetical protein
MNLGWQTRKYVSRHQTGFCFSLSQNSGFTSTKYSTNLHNFMKFNLSAHTTDENTTYELSFTILPQILALPQYTRSYGLEGFSCEIGRQKFKDVHVTLFLVLNTFCQNKVSAFSHVQIYLFFYIIAWILKLGANFFSHDSCIVRIKRIIEGKLYCLM